MSCKVCRRKFASTPNPLVKCPDEGDLLKQKGTLAQCAPCFYFIKSEPKYKDLNRSDMINNLINDDSYFGEYMQNLQNWEADRRDGKKRNSVTNTATSQTQIGVSTKQIKGYLWPRDLLEKHSLGDTLKKNKSTTISHMGKPVCGMLRDSWVLGAIEVSEDRLSQIKTLLLRMGPMIFKSGSRSGIGVGIVYIGHRLAIMRGMKHTLFFPRDEACNVFRSHRAKAK